MAQYTLHKTTFYSKAETEERAGIEQGDCLYLHIPFFIKYGIFLAITEHDRNLLSRVMEITGR